MHELIINEALFHEVKDFLDSKVSKYTAKEITIEAFAVFPMWPQFDWQRIQRVAVLIHYHCTAGCKERVKVEEANERFKRN